MIKSFRSVLGNGLRVVAVEMPHLHSAELAIYLKVGGRNDPVGKSGLSHFLEHMLFRGAENFSSSLEIEKAFEAAGGAPNAATDADSTCFYSRLHPDCTRRGMEIFSSMLFSPLFSGIETERRVIIEEAREDMNERGAIVTPELITSMLLWPGHPIGLPITGYINSISSITVDDLENHIRSYYLPERAVLTVAGPVSHKQVFSEACSVFGGWRGGESPEAVPFTKRFKSTKIALVRDSDSQMSMQIAFEGFARSDSRLTSLRLLRRILAGGGSSRLHLKLREEMGVVYSVEGSIGAYDETGCFALDMATSADSLVRSVEATISELKQLKSYMVPAEEIERIRRSYLFDLEFSQDSAFEMAGRYGWGELMGVVKSIEEEKLDICSVTAEDIMRTAHLLFVPENLRLAAAGPWKRGMKKEISGIVESL